MPTPAQTERLRFRQMVDDDVEAMAALLGDPTVMRFYPAPMTHDEAAGWIAWNQDNYRRHGFGLWTVTDLDGNFVGDCGLTWQRVNGVQRLEVGYHVRSDLQGRGLATEAAAAARDFARAELRAPELIAITHPQNRPSQRVAEKIGMHRIEDDLGDGTSLHWVHGMNLHAQDS